MLSAPIEDFEKACDCAEDAASKMSIDYAVIYVRENGYYVVTAMVDLDSLSKELNTGAYSITNVYAPWQLICIYDPQGVAYSWAKKQEEPEGGYEQ